MPEHGPERLIAAAPPCRYRADMAVEDTAAGCRLSVLLMLAVTSLTTGGVRIDGQVQWVAEPECKS